MKKLENKCKDCLYRIVFEQVFVDRGHFIHVCSHIRDEGLDNGIDQNGGESFYEISKFDSSRCLAYVRE